MESDIDRSLRQLQIEVNALKMIMLPGLARLGMQTGNLKRYLTELRQDAVESAGHFHFRNVPEANQEQFRIQLRERVEKILDQLEPESR